MLGIILVLVGLAFELGFARSSARIGQRIKAPSVIGKFALPAVFVSMAGRLVAG